jgi:hypothetical protein
MHDPMTLAFSIDIPLPWKRPSILKSKDKEWAKFRLADIWHVDPCKGPGGDDSCGWFKRAHHGDRAVLEKIIKRFECDWDRVFTSDSKHTYFCGLFCPNGDPHLSVSAIVLNLFFLASLEVFGTRDKAMRFVNRNIANILLFAENPFDSLHDSVTRKFQIGCGEKHDKRERDERIRSMASTIYGWILREKQPWYKHARWHVHHWKIQVPAISKFKRWAFSRCCKCGKGFKWGYVVTTNNWHGTGPLWFRSEQSVYHGDCNHPTDNCASEIACSAQKGN